MRYTVLPHEAMNAEDAFGADERFSSRPIDWPLELSVNQVVRRDPSWKTGLSERATGEDARRLRDVRASGADASVAIGYFPIVMPYGTRYELYIRDACPLEQANGLLPTGTF